MKIEISKENLHISVLKKIILGVVICDLFGLQNGILLSLVLFFLMRYRVIFSKDA